jgi:DTW domain-containing protein
LLCAAITFKKPGFLQVPMRPTCPLCYRPESLCLCAQIQTVDNRTEILVLQHPRERFHPFGSARMLITALKRGRVEVADGAAGKSLLHATPLPPNTGLLYPHSNAQELSTLAPAERPANLILIDGTWAHAKRVYQDNPWLQQLRHFAISPVRKSRYLVRREPNDWCLSTLEAAVEALQWLEPETAGLKELLAVFERMNTDQVQRAANSPRTPRRKRTRSRLSRALAPLVSHRLEDLVLVHAENAETGLRSEPSANELFYGAVARVKGGQSWHGFVRPTQGEPSTNALRRSGLQSSDIGAYLQRCGFVRGFQSFLRPRDVLVAWNTSTFRLLPAEVVAGREQLQLKAAYCNWRGGAAGMLASAVQRHRLTATQNQVPGRMGKQLALMQALLLFLHTAPTREPKAE